MLRSIPVVDETILSIVGTHPEDHVIPHNYYGYIGTKSFFPSLLPTTNHVKPANNGSVLK